MSGRTDALYSRPSSGHTVAYTGTAGTIAAGTIGDQTRKVVIWTTTDAHIAFGATATTSDFPIPANQPLLFKINPAESISAIQISSGGNLYVGELDS